MHIDRAIAAILGVAYPVFTIWCLVKGSRRPPHAENADTGVVCFGRALRIWWLVTISLCALGFASDVFLGKVDPVDSSRFWRALAGFVLLAATGTWILLRYRVEYDEQAIFVHSPFGTCRRIQWGEVMSVQQIKGTGLVIGVQGQKREVTPSWIAGTSQFVEAARLRQRG